jgi:thiol:disulfide interchange protein DsbC
MPMKLIRICRWLAAGLVALSSALPLSAGAQEQLIRKAVAERFPNAKVESVTKTVFPGLLELVVDGTVFYTDEKFTFLIDGSLIETKTWSNIHAQLAKLNDVTIYTFLYPIISPPDSVEKSRAVWCSKDRSRAWDEVMTTGKIAPAAANCKAPIDEVLKLGQKYNVKSTPTIFLSDGTRLRGALPVEQLEQAIATAAKAPRK